MLSTYTVKGKILPLLPVQPIEIVREGTSIEPTPGIPLMPCSSDKLGRDAHPCIVYYQILGL